MPTDANPTTLIQTLQAELAFARGQRDGYHALLLEVREQLRLWKLNPAMRRDTKDQLLDLLRRLPEVPRGVSRS